MGKGVSADKMVNNGGDDDGEDGGLTNNTRTKKAEVNCHDCMIDACLFHPSYL